MAGLHEKLRINPLKQAINKIKKSTSKLGCFLGIHKYEWENWDTHPCKKTGRCLRCKKHKVVTKHKFGGMHYESNVSCRLIQVCERCEAGINCGYSHAWGDGYFDPVEPCQIKYTCDRCGCTRYEENHNWGEWVYESPVSCKLIRFCRRCDEREDGEVEHKWEDISATTARCEHCGEYFTIEPAEE